MPTCPKRPRKWFGLVSQGHVADTEKSHIERWGARSWQKYEVTTVCKFCGAKNNSWGVDHREMIEAGFTPEQLEECQL